MTTVIDPAGTNGVVFNRDGTTILNMNAEMGDGNTPVTPIPHYSQKTIVIVTVVPIVPPYDQGGLELPVAAEIGDVIEFYGDGGSGLPPYRISTPTGETMLGPGNPVTRIMQSNRLTKISATQWVVLIT